MRTMECQHQQTLDKIQKWVEEWNKERGLYKSAQSVQQIGRTVCDKREKEWKEVGGKSQ